jgi:hypothetical protein
MAPSPILTFGKMEFARGRAAKSNSAEIIAVSRSIAGHHEIDSRSGNSIGAEHHT